MKLLMQEAQFIRILALQCIMVCQHMTRRSILRPLADLQAFSMPDTPSVSLTIVEIFGMAGTHGCIYLQVLVGSRQGRGAYQRWQG